MRGKNPGRPASRGDVMINIKYNRKLSQVKIKGHAASAEKGKDIICASVSMLAYTLAQNLRFAEQQGYVEDLEILLDEGDARIVCRPVENEETVECIFETIGTGFLLLKKNYPEFVRFVVVG